MPTAAASPTEWQWCHFDALDSHALYAILAQRQDVFVLEQTCLFQDIDFVDQQSWHLLGWQSDGAARRLAAYLRCVPPGLKFAEASIGRVLTARWARGSGLGKELFAQGVARTAALFPESGIRISAQQYLEAFYASYGFDTRSAPYLEDGIWHVDMLRSP